MFGIYADVTPAIDILDAMTDNAIQSPALMATLFQRSMTRLGQRGVEQLDVEPPSGNTAGITSLMTPRQARRLRGGGDYPRTHGISHGWKYKVVALDAGGEFVVYNGVPGVNYVEGWDQQPFLAYLGWLFAPPILAEIQAEGEDISIENWYTASDLYAGVPQT